MTAPKVGKITFALVDVKGGRAAIEKLVEDHKQRIPITLSGYLVSQWGGDDGTSIQFEMEVRKQRIKSPVPQTCHCVHCEARRVEHKAGKAARRAIIARADRNDAEGGIPGRNP